MAATNPTTAAITDSERLNHPPSRRNVIQSEANTVTALNARKTGPTIAPTTEALLIPATDNAAGITQHGRVRTPATTPPQLLERTERITGFPSR